MSGTEKTLAFLAALVGVRTSGPRKPRRPRMADEIARLRAENAALTTERHRLARIIVALPNPIARKMLDRDGIDEASDEQWREAVDDANRAICAAVAAAEQEAQGE